MSNATLEMMQEIEQAAQGVIVGYEAQVEQIRTVRAIALQQWHSITMRKPSNWSQRQKKKRPGKTRPFNERSGRNGCAQ